MKFQASQLHHIPATKLAAGNPCRVIRHLDAK